jgi:hypothetical protein
MSLSYRSACSDDVEHLACSGCRAPMVITHIEEPCLGRYRQIFECLAARLRRNGPAEIAQDARWQNEIIFLF